MGRYTTVQTYTDQDAKVAAIAYATASGGEGATGDSGATGATGANDATGADEATGEARGERFRVNRVDNVSGSTAGAGSGEFHVYRASRRRELERVALMERQHAEREGQREFERQRKRKAEALDATARKRADKRRRRKERQRARELHGDEQDEQEKDKQDKQGKEEEEGEEELRETPGGVAAIPNDGSFLERMLALQKADKQEQRGGEQAR